MAIRLNFHDNFARNVPSDSQLARQRGYSSAEFAFDGVQVGTSLIQERRRAAQAQHRQPPQLTTGTDYMPHICSMYNSSCASSYVFGHVCLSSCTMDNCLLYEPAELRFGSGMAWLPAHWVEDMP